MGPRSLLRLEGLAVFAGATGAFVVLDGPWWLYLLLILAPDLGMLGYLAGPAVGARTYNALHTTAAPLGLVAVGWWTAASLFVLVGLVWLAHVGIDRAIGYGLKYPNGFRDSHLERLRVGESSTPRR